MFHYLLLGDRVFGVRLVGFQDADRGVLREYVLIKQNFMVKVPDNISLKEASCFPVTGINHHYYLHIMYFLIFLKLLGCTAYGFLVEKAQLKKGDRVFITGGSGAVGVMAIQLARTIVGSTGLVVTTCSPAKSDIIRSLGADEVFGFLLKFIVSKNIYIYLFLRSSIISLIICRIIFESIIVHVPLM